MESVQSARRASQRVWLASVTRLQRSTAWPHASAKVRSCSQWLFWNESVDDVDPQHAIRYEVRVNGVFDGAQTGIDRWITYGTQTSNTFSVQAVDSAGNRSPTSSVTLTNQTC
jgi:nicotinamide mononucleotide adenylyltransferase